MNSFLVSIMIEIFCCCWIHCINRKQIWFKTTRPTWLDGVFLFFPNEFKDTLFPLLLSTPSDSARIFFRALSVASKEFVYTIFGVNKLFAANREGGSYGVLCRSKRGYRRTSSATRGSGDECLSLHSIFKRRNKNVPKRGKRRHKGYMQFMRLRREGARWHGPTWWEGLYWWRRLSAQCSFKPKEIREEHIRV